MGMGFPELENATFSISNGLFIEFGPLHLELHTGVSDTMVAFREAYGSKI